uniref:Uncharacterized protein n=1 Tax=Anopheles coluzzii TaxID=1518534 RepID=A0A8W7PEW6_ANOCL
MHITILEQCVKNWLCCEVPEANRSRKQYVHVPPRIGTGSRLDCTGLSGIQPHDTVLLQTGCFVKEDVTPIVSRLRYGLLHILHRLPNTHFRQLVTVAFRFEVHHAGRNPSHRLGTGIVRFQLLKRLLHDHIQIKRSFVRVCGQVDVPQMYIAILKQCVKDWLCRVVPEANRSRKQYVHVPLRIGPGSRLDCTRLSGVQPHNTVLLQAGCFVKEDVTPIVGRLRHGLLHIVQAVPGGKAVPGDDLETVVYRRIRNAAVQDV